MPWCRSGSIIESRVVSWPPCRLAVEVNTPAGLPASAPRSHSERGAVEEILERRRHVAEAGRAAEREPGAFLQVAAARSTARRPRAPPAASPMSADTRGTVRRRAAAPGTLLDAFGRQLGHAAHRAAHAVVQDEDGEGLHGSGSLRGHFGIIKAMEKNAWRGAAEFVDRRGAPLLRGPRRAGRGQPRPTPRSFRSCRCSPWRCALDRLSGVRRGDQHAAALPVRELPARRRRPGGDQRARSTSFTEQAGRLPRSASPFLVVTGGDADADRSTTRSTASSACAGAGRSLQQIIIYWA